MYFWYVYYWIVEMNRNSCWSCFVNSVYYLVLIVLVVIDGFLLDVLFVLLLALLMILVFVFVLVLILLIVLLLTTASAIP